MCQEPRHASAYKCMCDVPAIAPFEFNFTTGEGALQTLECFGREMHFSPMAELLNC